MRHRAILHSSFGIYLLEQVFGVTITNSDGKIVSVRDIGEDHVLQDLGYIPTIQDYLEGMPFYDWLGGQPRKSRRTFTHGLEETTSGESNKTPDNLAQIPPMLPLDPADIIFDGPGRSHTDESIDDADTDSPVKHFSKEMVEETMKDVKDWAKRNRKPGYID